MKSPFYHVISRKLTRIFPLSTSKEERFRAINKPLAIEDIPNTLRNPPPPPPPPPDPWLGAPLCPPAWLPPNAAAAAPGPHPAWFNAAATRAGFIGRAPRLRVLIPRGFPRGWLPCAAPIPPPVLPPPVIPRACRFGISKFPLPAWFQVPPPAALLAMPEPW
ncbi:hypothetical protein J437_LFUL004924 [Ladona fulva]|uniref:Uncharacterized protein n=1 Tax=Ladona fulva TaxID=123851 RepID=A0A8K0P1Y2_LADFU|nr:hypothetical protein J437_LFUL004924 [Ladona fulva]